MAKSIGESIGLLASAYAVFHLTKTAFFAKLPLREIVLTLGFVTLIAAVVGVVTLGSWGGAWLGSKFGEYLSKKKT